VACYQYVNVEQERTKLRRGTGFKISRLRWFQARFSESCDRLGAAPIAELSGRELGGVAKPSKATALKTIYINSLWGNRGKQSQGGYPLLNQQVTAI
jgi:hypothetical protein